MTNTAAPESGVLSLVLHFALPKSCYATMFMRDILRMSSSPIAYIGGEDKAVADA